MGNQLFKGIFWVRPEGSGKFTVIAKKVLCAPSGEVIDKTVEFSSKSGENFNHKSEWRKLPKNITQGHEYNYYPRGRVEIKNNKATVYINPVLNTPAVMDLLDEEFGLCCEEVLVRTVTDGSAHYEYLMDYPLKHCHMCGKIFDFWDNQENFCFDHYIGYGSKYDMERIRLNLCCDCFDKTLDWLLPQCVCDPMTEYELR